MNVKEVMEHEDGTATVELTDISPEMLNLLVQEGFIALLKKYIDQEEKAAKTAALLKE
jgi:hypothetical protein